MRTFVSTLLLLFGSCLPWCAAAQIYKSVDEQGNVVFSDVPPREDGQRVVVTPLNTYATPAEAAPAEEPATAAAAVDAQYYRAIEIVDPTADEAIRENAGNLVVSVATVPAVRGDHRLVLVMDGRALALESSGSVFTLANIDRGSHTISARIVDSSEATVTESAPVTFHMLRAAAAKKVVPRPAKPAG
jgi:hypothetical protein